MSTHLYATVLTVAALTFGFQSSAHADFESRLEQRLARQANRIELGLEEGSLTYKEERRLQRQQRSLVKLSNRFILDDHYSRKEKRILRKKLNAASEQIRRLRNNHAVVRYVQNNHSYDTYSYQPRVRQIQVYQNTTRYTPVVKRCDSPRYVYTTRSQKTHYKPVQRLSIAW